MTFLFPDEYAIGAYHRRRGVDDGDIVVVTGCQQKAACQDSVEHPQQTLFHRFNSLIGHHSHCSECKDSE
jgi:hypothetical protein